MEFIPYRVQPQSVMDKTERHYSDNLLCEIMRQVGKQVGISEN
jgi:hypothetical protein